MEDSNNSMASFMDSLFSAYQHYYIRLEDHTPIATVAIGRIKDSDIACRGIAICSDKDNFDRSRGRKLAYRRMVDAALSKQTKEPVLDSYSRVEGKDGMGNATIDQFLDVVDAEVGEKAYEYEYKSGYRAWLSDRETKILESETRRRVGKGGA
jgi:hypothetical protein